MIVVLFPLEVPLVLKISCGLMRPGEQNVAVMAVQVAPLSRGEQPHFPPSGRTRIRPIQRETENGRLLGQINTPPVHDFEL